MNTDKHFTPVVLSDADTVKLLEEHCPFLKHARSEAAKREAAKTPQPNDDK